MESTANQSQQTLTLAAGVAGALTFDTSGSKSICLVIENTGANAVGTTVATVSPDGTIYGTNSALGTTVGSIASGASALVEIDAVAFAKLKLTFTSASGSSVRVTMRGT